MSIGTILLIVLVLILLGVLPVWPHARSWGYGPSGGLGVIVVILLVPFRWIYVDHPGPYLITVFVIYWSILVLVNWRHRDLTLFLYPFYGMFNSLCLVPLGLVSYFWMAIPEGNWGWIRLSVHRNRRRVSAVSRPESVAAPTR